MRKPAFAPLFLIIALVAQTGCGRPALSPLPPTPGAIGWLEINQRGQVMMSGKSVSLEEVTRCNPAAHAEALRAHDTWPAPMVLLVIGSVGEVASISAVLTQNLYHYPAVAPSWLLGLMIGGQVWTLGLLITAVNLPDGVNHKRNAVNLYNQGRPPCGPPLSAAPAKDPHACVADAGACAFDTDCCGGQCSGGKCGCIADGQSCLSGKSCCGGQCTAGMCGCVKPGEACLVGVECCSGSCNQGKCSP